MFFLIGAGLTEAFIIIVLCVFIPYEISHYHELVALFTSLMLISFLKFLILIMTITKLNIKYIVKEIDTQNTINTEMQVKVDEIYQRIVNGKK